jgi:hypothetical protein
MLSREYIVFLESLPCNRQARRRFRSHWHWVWKWRDEFIESECVMQEQLLISNSSSQTNEYGG